MTLPRCPDKNSTHKGAIRKPNQCETTQLIQNVIHTPSPDPTKTIYQAKKNMQKSFPTFTPVSYKLENYVTMNV